MAYVVAAFDSASLNIHWSLEGDPAGSSAGAIPQWSSTTGNAMNAGHFTNEYNSELRELKAWPYHAYSAIGAATDPDDSSPGSLSFTLTPIIVE